MEKFLPIGTVVLLKEAKKRLMIVGLLPVVQDENKEVTYDYCGCLFPEGVLDSDQNLLFNHDQIDKVFYYGLIDEEQKLFSDNLTKEILKEQSEAYILPEIEQLSIPDIISQVEKEKSEKNEIVDLPKMKEE